MANVSRWPALFSAIVLALFTACASVPSPPHELIERNDHAALAAWYEQDAAHLRAHAEDMRQMAKNYKLRMTKPHQFSELVEHCERMAERYTEAAEHADALAKLHREQIGKS